MKKIFLIAVITSVLAPTVLHAAEVLNVDRSAIGINETLYDQLSTAHCYMTDAPMDAIAVPGGAKCDPVVARFADKVVFRAFHLGEMYRVNAADGAPIVMRYLPDGFYKVDHKFYWVADNQRVRITKRNFYKRIVLTAQRNPDSVMPINNSDFGLFLVSCEAYNGASLDPVCLRKVEEGTMLQQRLARKIVMKIDDGSLWYIPQNSGLSPQPLSSSLPFSTISDYAAPVGEKTMQEMYPNNDWQ